MNIIITSDIHCGFPGKLKDCLWSLHAIREYANKNNISTILILGDLFHDRVNLNIEVKDSVYKFLNETKHEYKQEWLCFPGNHDMFLKNSWNINSIHSLKDVLTIIENVDLIEIFNKRFWIIPFIYYENVYMSILDKIKDDVKDNDILLTHIGINNAIMNECFLVKNWSVVNFSSTNFSRIYAGHFHCYQTVDNVTYPGSPIPFRFDEGMVDHGFIVYNTDDNTDKFINISETNYDKNNIPSDYISIIDEDVNNKKDLTNCNVRITLTSDKTQKELQDIKNSIMDMGAKSVTWIKKRDKIDVNSINKIKDVDIKKPTTIFESWLNKDNPNELSKELLLQLNDQIVCEVEEQMLTEDDYEEE